MSSGDPRGGRGDAIAMIGLSNVRPNRLARGVLHRDTIGLGADLQGLLFLVGKAQGHCHAGMVSLRYQWNRGIWSDLGNSSVGKRTPDGVTSDQADSVPTSA